MVRLSGMTLPSLVLLASASPRRKDLLRSLAIPFEVSPTDIDESLFPGEAPSAASERLAREKARAAASRAHPDCLVIAADTLVVLDGRALGKPIDPEDAKEMLRSLSGRRHEVVTGLALLLGGKLVSGCETTGVFFRRLDSSEIEHYVATGEPDDKAGAYALQGIAGLFVERVDGSPSGVVGLPVSLLDALARKLGIELLSFAPARTRR
jgi:septum formation protein